MIENKKPNLLYIHSDQHNPYVTGCYGDTLVETPNLDALAQRGVVLENTYCPSPICVPSRMSMLSGKYPYENEVWTNMHTLDSRIPTFAQAMGAGGFRPTLIGRMHSVGADQLQGYVERLIGDHGSNRPGGKGNGGHGIGGPGPTRSSLKESGHGQSAYQVHDEDVTAATVHYLDSLGVQRRAGQSIEPFSLSVGFMLPHQPFIARKEDYERYYDRVKPPQYSEAFSEHLHPHIKWWREACDIKEGSAEEIHRCRAAYWALVYRMDVMIGQIMTALRENGFEENTLVVYMSDHGEQVGEHSLWWKQTFYEHSVKVPAILSWPGHLPEGIRCNKVTSSLDLNATMLDALECPALPHSRGRSLLPLLTESEEVLLDKVAFSEFCQNAAGAGGPFPEEGIYQRMVRRDNFKLNYYHGQPCQLFDLEADPQETTDLSSDPSYKEIVDQLTAEVLNGWDPELIRTKIIELGQDMAIQTGWTKNIQPPDSIRWTMKPEMSYLDNDQMS